MIFSLAPLCLGFLWAQCTVWAKSRASLPPESSVCPAGHQVPTPAGVQGLVWLVLYSFPHRPWTHWDSSLPSPDMHGGGAGARVEGRRALLGLNPGCATHWP